MNTKRVNSAAGVINAALTQNRTAAGIALALESAQLLLTSETAAELERYRAMELGDTDSRVSATCDDPGHPTWLRKPDDERGCPWCRVAELEAAEKRRADVLERCRVDAAEQAQRETDPGRRAAWRMLAGEHEAAVHHSYRLGRDLPPTGGQR